MIVNAAHHTAADSMLIRTASAGAEPERVVQGHHGQVDREQQPAAEVAERPAARGDPVALVGLGAISHRIAS